MQYLSAFSASWASGCCDPFPKVQFCPTGGIGLHNIERYLELPNVFAVGGSWIAPHKLIRDKRWGEIEALASEAISICGS